MWGLYGSLEGGSEETDSSCTDLDNLIMKLGRNACYQSLRARALDCGEYRVDKNIRGNIRRNFDRQIGIREMLKLGPKTSHPTTCDNCSKEILTIADRLTGDKTRLLMIMLNGGQSCRTVWYVRHTLQTNVFVSNHNALKPQDHIRARLFNCVSR